MNVKDFLFLICMALSFVSIDSKLFAAPFPINFSIPKSKIVKKIPEKDLDFAPLLPGVMSTYIYDEEADYYKDYQRSYFAVTCRKSGWDCMRHYEILANGCIPYFVDLDHCDKDTMFFLPRELILEAMHLPGVSYLHIDHQKFDREKYFEILNKLLEHTRQHLTTRKMARYILKKIGYTGKGKILFLSPNTSPDYMRCLTLIGLKELYKNEVVDFPKIGHIYTSYGDVKGLYGRGISYTKIVPDLPVNRKDIEQRIIDKEFDLIVYGSVHRGLPYLELVQRVYEPEKVVYICGEDSHTCSFTKFPNFFLREFEAYQDR